MNNDIRTVTNANAVATIRLEYTQVADTPLEDQFCDTSLSARISLNWRSMQFYFLETRGCRKSLVQ